MNALSEYETIVNHITPKKNILAKNVNSQITSLEKGIITWLRKYCSEDLGTTNAPCIQFSIAPEYEEWLKNNPNEKISLIEIYSHLIITGYLNGGGVGTIPKQTDMKVYLREKIQQGRNHDVTK